MASQTEREVWLKKIANLRVDRARGSPAPHKPLLLLVVLDLAEAGQLSAPELVLTGELAFRFLTYGNAVAPQRNARLDIRLPFFHLKSEGFWRPLDESEKSAVHYRQATHAAISPNFFSCLHDEGFCRQARILIASRYFEPAGQIALEQVLGISLPAPNVINDALPDLDGRAAVADGREARFRLTVVPAYDFTCALTGYRLVTIDSGSIVDAAHLHKFTESRNNDPANGIALSKNAHWLFDQGLWSLTDDFEVLVARDRFHETGPEAFSLLRREGQRILLPSSPALWPAHEHLGWHRRAHGFSDS